MKSPLVVAFTCLGVLGFSGHCSSLDVDLDGLKEAFLSSDVGLEPFTAAHLSRTRRNDEGIEETSCCGDFNREMVKKRATFRKECYNAMRNRKFECEKSKVELQAEYQVGEVEAIRLPRRTVVRRLQYVHEECLNLRKELTQNIKDYDEYKNRHYQ
ncbi:uncharacterized protein [Periplaneta americana]|uniref:uncharacterized protein n=1 Tax=Periplaneta americana TaxID=6978 RepID=UPI0037E88459